MSRFLSELIKTTLFFMVMSLMIVISVTNVVFSNGFGETCGITHPYIFQISASMLNPETGAKVFSLSDPSIPVSGEETLDPYLRIYDAQGRLIIENDDLGSLNSGVENFPLGRYQTVTVEVATFGDYGAGYYALRAENVPNASVVDALFDATLDGVTLEPNQSIAGTITQGERQSYLLVSDYPVTISVIGVDGIDPYLRVYALEGELLAENDDYEGLNPALVNFRANDYFGVTIEVATYGDNSSGSYQLVISPSDGTGGTSATTTATGIPLQMLSGGEMAIGNQSGLIRPAQRVRYILTATDPNQAVSLYLEKDKDQRFGLPVRLFGDLYTASGWNACIEYYGYVDDNSLRLNQNGVSRYIAYENQQSCPTCEIIARVNLTLWGQFLMYIISPGLVILLPIAAIYTIRSNQVQHHGIVWSIKWIMMLMLVALHVLTTSLLYVHFANSSGIEALANFAYGILAGAATGSAIAFMGKVLDAFSID